MGSSLAPNSSRRQTGRPETVNGGRVTSISKGDCIERTVWGELETSFRVLDWPQLVADCTTDCSKSKLVVVVASSASAPPGGAVLRAFAALGSACYRRLAICIQF